MKIIKDNLHSLDIVCFLTSLSALPFTTDKPVFHVDSHVIAMLADTVTSQEIICVANVKTHTLCVPKDNFLVLDNLQDPGNVGTLIRTAKASAFSYVFLIDSVSVTNSKLIRSSAGAVFDEKVIPLTCDEFVKFAKENKLRLLKCDMDGKNIFSYEPKGMVGVVIGNEGQGVRDKISALCVDSIKIPMQDGIESLNAGVSGSIIMYQINKNKFI